LADGPRRDVEILRRFGKGQTPRGGFKGAKRVQGGVGSAHRESLMTESRQYNDQKIYFYS
jgi:hypothetical protein